MEQADVGRTVDCTHGKRQVLGKKLITPGTGFDNPSADRMSASVSMHAGMRCGCVPFRLEHGCIAHGTALDSRLLCRCEAAALGLRGRVSINLGAW
jgi:hypothetical protein